MFGIGRTAGLEGKGIIRIFGVYGPDIVRVDSVEKGTEELDRPEKGENFPGTYIEPDIFVSQKHR